MRKMLNAAWLAGPATRNAPLSMGAVSLRGILSQNDLWQTSFDKPVAFAVLTLSGDKAPCAAALRTLSALRLDAALPISPRSIPTRAERLRIDAVAKRALGAGHVNCNASAADGPQNGLSCARRTPNAP